MYSSLQGLWFEPRRSSLRLWMLRIHKWAGVGTGLLSGNNGILAGPLSIFLPELRNTLVAPIARSASIQTARTLTRTFTLSKHNEPIVRG
jgi:hypothetical protein